MTDEKRYGRWTVVKDTGIVGTPWQSLLWGGNDAHPADGAMFTTWREAFDTAERAARETPWPKRAQFMA